MRRIAYALVGMGIMAQVLIPINTSPWLPPPQPPPPVPSPYWVPPYIQPCPHAPVGLECSQ